MIAYRAKGNFIHIPDNAVSVASFVILFNFFPHRKILIKKWTNWKSLENLAMCVQQQRSRRDFSDFSHIFFLSIFSDCLFDCANFSCVVISTALIFIYLFILRYAYICSVTGSWVTTATTMTTMWILSFSLLLCLFLHSLSVLCSDIHSIIIIYMFGSTIYHSLDFCVFVMFGFERECVWGAIVHVSCAKTDAKNGFIFSLSCSHSLPSRIHENIDNPSAMQVHVSSKT